MDRMWAAEYTPATIESLFTKARSKTPLTDEEIDKFRSALVSDFAGIRRTHARGWVQQYHLGAMRNNNARFMRTLGPDTGFDWSGIFPRGRRWPGFSIAWTAPTSSRRPSFTT